MATLSPDASATLRTQPRRRFGELLSGRTRTWPNLRPLGALSTQKAKASRESRATSCAPFRASGKSGDAVRNFTLRFVLEFMLRAFYLHGTRLVGAGGYQGRHRRVGAHRGPVEDGLIVARRYLAAQAQVLGDGLAGMPALRDKDGDQDYVLRVDVLYDLAYLGGLVQEANLHGVVEVALPYAPGVEVDDPAGALVQVGAVPEQDERPPAGWDLLTLEQVLRPLQDHVGHPRVGPQGPRIPHRLISLAGDGTGQPELAWYHLLGEVPLRDKGRHDVDFSGLDRVEHVTHGGFFFPE